MTKQYTVTLAIQQTIIEGILSNPTSKNAVDEEMESACMAILEKRYAKLGADLREYLQMRYPNGEDGTPIPQETNAKNKLKGAPRGRKPYKNDGNKEIEKSAESALTQATTSESDAIYENSITGVTGSTYNESAAKPIVNPQVTTRLATPQALADVSAIPPVGGISHNGPAVNLSPPSSIDIPTYRAGTANPTNTFDPLFNQHSQQAHTYTVADNNRPVAKETGQSNYPLQGSRQQNAENVR